MNTPFITLVLLGMVSSFAQAQANATLGTDSSQTDALPSASRALQAPVPAPAERRTTARIAFTYDDLSGDLPSWREYGLAVNHEIDQKQFVEAGLLRTSRFDLEDNQVHGLYLYKFTSDLVATFEGNYSPTHRVLPEYTLGASISYTFLPATVGQLGIKTTSYDETRVNQVSIGVERYIGAFSIGATWRPAHAFGENINGGEIRGNYYYGERSRIGILLAAGEEVTPIGAQKIITEVRAGAIIGQHWVSPDWAVTYAVSRTRQGDLYNRTGVNIGLQYAF